MCSLRILPINASLSLENALRNVSMFFRSEPSWSIVNPLKGIGKNSPTTLSLSLPCLNHVCGISLYTFTFAPPTIGWRIRKQYYLIQSKGDVKLPQHLLTWVSP